MFLKRAPMIKFNRKGPTLKFVPDKFPISLVSSAGITSSSSSSKRVGKGIEIEESQLPLKFRRQLISDEECEIINEDIMNVLFYDYYELSVNSDNSDNTVPPDELANSFILLINHIMSSCSKEEEERIAQVVDGIFTQTVQTRPSSYAFINSKKYNQYNHRPTKKFSIPNFVKPNIQRSVSNKDISKKGVKKDRAKSSGIMKGSNNSLTDGDKTKRKLKKDDSTKVANTSKKKDNWISQDEILINILKAITLAKTQLSVILFCKLLKGFVFYCKPHLSQSRLKKFVKIDAANYLLSCLKHKISTYENPTMMKIAAVDALSMLTLYICSKDSKLSIKTRLMGLLPLFADIIVNINYMSCTLNVTLFILRTLKSPRNAQTIGRIKGFCSNIISTLNPILQSSSITLSNTISDSIEITKVERLLEIIYCLSKNRKNKNIFVDCGGIQVTKDLFEKYFYEQLNNNSTIQLVNQEICLFLIATIRLFAKTRKSKEILINLEILNMCEKFLSQLDIQLSNVSEKDSLQRLQSLQDSLCALCMRCLPNKSFFIQPFEAPPLKFYIPGEDEEDKNNFKNRRSSSFNISIDSNDITNINYNSSKINTPKRQKSMSDCINDSFLSNSKKNMAICSPVIYEGDIFDESNDSFTFNYNLQSDSDDENVDEEDEAIISSQCSAEFSPPTIDLDESDLLSYGIENISESGYGLSNTKKLSSKNFSKKNSNKSFSKLYEKIEIINQSVIPNKEVKCNYEKYFCEYTDNEYDYTCKSTSSDYKEIITNKCNETRSVGKFVKIAYPEYFNPDQIMKEEECLITNNDAMKNMIKDNLQRHNCHDNKLKNNEVVEYPKLVYNLDELVKDTNYPEKLSNNDVEKIGSGSSHCDHLKFESRFESGNLRRAYQIDDNYYQLILSPDINQKSHHYQWFYFQVSNVNNDREYVFEIINCLKSTSMFSHGMQPVIFSVTDSLQNNNNKKGWRRTGNNICYFRNLYTLNLKNNNEAGEKDTCDGNPEKVKYLYSIRFSIKFEHKNDICYLAYHYPYTYSYLQATLETIIKKRKNIIYRIDEIGKTLNKNSLKLITITASPFDKNREMIVLSARVHPGETNSSWIMHGILKFLLDKDDKNANSLREKYIFKIIPMLNPDGVINGNHRCSLSGNDLNRTWHNPIKFIHPEIYHSKAIIQYCVEILKRKPFVYVDLHGHSRRSNVFVFGNNPEESWLEEDSKKSNDKFMILPEILESNSHAFSLSDSRFSIAKSKESSARIALWRQFGIERAYTMESTYCGFDKKMYQGKQININHLMDVGVDLCQSFLNLWDINSVEKKN
uniref:Pepdidase_M14_N domain-containing protein n=1 Tax=Parastrongyloides trichosuri TaxID=131310 RepID=A0A0N4Z244_PARTI